MSARAQNQTLKDSPALCIRTLENFEEFEEFYETHEGKEENGEDAGEVRKGTNSIYPSAVQYPQSNM